MKKLLIVLTLSAFVSCASHKEHDRNIASTTAEYKVTCPVKCHGNISKVYRDHVSLDKAVQACEEVRSDFEGSLDRVRCFVNPYDIKLQLLGKPTQFSVSASCKLRPYTTKSPYYIDVVGNSAREVYQSCKNLNRELYGHSTKWWLDNLRYNRD